MTQADLAAIVPIKPGTLGKWESGQQNAPRHHVLTIARKLGIPEQWFYDGQDTPPPIGRVLSPADIVAEQKASTSEVARVSLTGTPLVAVPVVGKTGAGNGEHNVDPDDWNVYVPDRLATLGGQGWVVTGPSMLPALEPGDVALFKEIHEPRPGYTFLIARKDGHTIKNIEWKNKRWTLVSINPDFPDMPLEEDDEIQGMLIGWYRAKGARETIDSDPGGLKLERPTIY